MCAAKHGMIGGNVKSRCLPAPVPPRPPPPAQKLMFFWGFFCGFQIWLSQITCNWLATIQYYEQCCHCWLYTNVGTYSLKNANIYFLSASVFWYRRITQTQTETDPQCIFKHRGVPEDYRLLDLARRILSIIVLSLDNKIVMLSDRWRFMLLRTSKKPLSMNL